MPISGGQQQQEMAYYAAFFDKKFGHGAGQAFLTWAGQVEPKAPTATPYQLAQGFLVKIETQGLAKVLTEILGGAQSSATKAGKGAAAGAGAGIANMTSGASIFALGHWVCTFVAHLSDLHMWISLGWLALGILLVMAGITYWARGAVLGAAGTIAKAAA